LLRQAGIDNGVVRWKWAFRWLVMAGKQRTLVE